MNDQPRVSWDYGTAYDLFASLYVLHEPEKFGLRASWAAGVRSRLPTEERSFLEQAQAAVRFPLGWIHNLPEPKDARTAIWALSQLPPAERLLQLSHGSGFPEQVFETLHAVAGRAAWTEQDLDAIKAAFQERANPLRSRTLETMLELWTRPDLFGERYLAGLHAYYESFFAEEEARIDPALRAAVELAQAETQKLPFDEQIEVLSHGIRFGMHLEIGELILAPSYWVSPLMVYERVSSRSGVLLFGARPDEVSLVPGELVPDAMLRALKALADPTRLRILRYLAHESLNPAELARRLRLRAPTLTHHLNALRLAGLVVLTLKDGNERFYSTRLDGVQATFSTLLRFLVQADDLPEG